MERFASVDGAGRLVIPKELRVRLHIHKGCRVRIAEEDGRIVLEPLPEEARLEERDGLLLVRARLASGRLVDHGTLRDERLDRLSSWPR